MALVIYLVEYKKISTGSTSKTTDFKRLNQLYQKWLTLLIPSYWLSPAEYEGVIRAHPQGDHHGQDVHEGEESEAEYEGVGEVSQAQGGRYGGERGQGDGERGRVGPHQQRDQHQREEQVGGVLQQVRVKQSILQTWKQNVDSPIKLLWRITNVYWWWLPEDESVQ